MPAAAQIGTALMLTPRPKPHEAQREILTGARSPRASRVRSRVGLRGGMVNRFMTEHGRLPLPVGYPECITPRRPLRAAAARQEAMRAD